MKRCLFFVICFLSISARGQKEQSLENKLQGRMGCGIINNTAAPSKIQIRCMSTIAANEGPAIVVDGVLIESSALSKIDPQQIETVSILKDAAATALYGSRASQGVILVTLKKLKACKLLIIAEDDSLPVGGATIKIRSTNSSQTFFSDTNGELTLPALQKGYDYIFEVSSIGYAAIVKSSRFDSSEQQITIQLKRAFKKLDEVVISSSTIRRRGCGVSVRYFRNQPNTKFYFSSPKKDFLLFPSPVSKGQTLTIVPGETMSSNYTIISMAGQIIRSGTTNASPEQPFQVNTANWPAGTYLIRLADDVSGKHFTQKFIVQ